MTDKVHGGVHGGEFLTGKMDFFTIDTLVSLDQTNVTTPSADLYQISASVWTPVTITDGHGVAQTYNNKSDYDDAYDMQQNLDAVLAAFAIRANPVMVSVSVSNYSVTGVFGGNYTGNADVAQINLATEKSGLWFVDVAETNEAGYGLDVALDGVAGMATMSGAGKNTNIARRTVL